MLDLIYLVLFFLFLTVNVWSFYNIPVLAAGVRRLLRNRNRFDKKLPSAGILPTFSIIIPAKNEEKVIGRLLDALTKLCYPTDKMEIIVVEDGSDDRTLDVCSRYDEKGVLNLKVLHRSFSNGKPSALNHGIKNAKGEIIGILDADSLPEQDLLLNASKHFEDSSVAAVQGRTLSINSEENILTKFLSYEETVSYEAYLQGKDVLGLFVHLKGSCQFIRRDLLDKLNGFDENVLSEDLEISARLAEKGCRIKYASDVRTWQESPANLRQLFRQRTRWFRGTMEVAFKYGKLMARPCRKNIDVEATLFGPFVLIASLVTYFAAFLPFFTSFSVDSLWQCLMQSATLIMTLVIFLCGLALIYCSKPRKVASVMWLPFIYFYWSLQVFIALFALLLILFHRPRVWLRTEKRGVITNSVPT